jgi:hypothetical protein
MQEQKLAKINFQPKYLNIIHNYSKNVTQAQPTGFSIDFVFVVYIISSFI